MYRLITVALAVAALALPAVVAASRSATPGVIAYEAPDGIHLVNGDGSGDRRLPGSTAGDQNPKWSPDGKRLVIAHATRGTEGDLVVLDATTGRREPVTGAVGEFPAWTPDGSAIVFDSDAGSTTQLYSVRPDGSSLGLLTARYSYEPAFAPDGTLAFGGEGGKHDVAILTEAKGGAVRELPTRHDAWAPSWSPDGSALLFDTDGDYAGGSGANWSTEIHRIGSNGSDEQRLTHNRFWDGDPAVSPDGTQIAFESGRFGWLEISVMNADGSQKRRITRELHGDACCPSWRPAP